MLFWKVTPAGSHSRAPAWSGCQPVAEFQLAHPPPPAGPSDLTPVPCREGRWWGALRAAPRSRHTSGARVAHRAPVPSGQAPACSVALRATSSPPRAAEASSGVRPVRASLPPKRGRRPGRGVPAAGRSHRSSSGCRPSTERRPPRAAVGRAGLGEGQAPSEPEPLAVGCCAARSCSCHVPGPVEGRRWGPPAGPSRNRPWGGTCGSW